MSEKLLSLVRYSSKIHSDSSGFLFRQDHRLAALSQRLFVSRNRAFGSIPFWLLGFLVGPELSLRHGDPSVADSIMLRSRWCHGRPRLATEIAG